MQAKPTADDYRPWEESGQFRRDCEPHRGAWLRPLGLLAIVLAALTGFFLAPALVSFPLGLAVRSMARDDLARMATGEVDPNGRRDTRDARDYGGAAAVCSVVLPVYLSLVFGGLFFLLK